MKTLTTRRRELRLDPIEPGDQRLPIGWLQSPRDVFRWSGATFSHPLTEAQLRAHVRDDPDRAMGFKAVRVSSGAPVGYIELCRIDDRRRCATICRTLVAPAQRGSGVGSEMVELVLERAFVALGMRRVELRTFEAGFGAVPFYERLGFSKQDAPRVARSFEGRSYDLVLMGMRREDWRATRSPNGGGLPGAITRRAWGAQPPRRRYLARGPLDTVVLHHTELAAAELEGAGVPAESAYMCRVQTLHLDRGWMDIGYHFVIMPSGRIFLGRPATARGAHVVGHNVGSLAIALAGDFDLEWPADAAIAAIDVVRRRLVAGASDVPMVCHGDLDARRCPGEHLSARLTGARVSR